MARRRLGADADLAARRVRSAHQGRRLRRGRDPAHARGSAAARRQRRLVERREAELPRHRPGSGAAPGAAGAAFPLHRRRARRRHLRDAAQVNRYALVLLGAALLPATSRATEGLAFCARLESIDERLACYDDLARASESAQGWPVDSSPTPSHLSEAWKLGARQASARRLTDILGYRPTYIITRWTSDPNEQPTSPAPGRTSPVAQDLDSNELKFQISFKAELASRQAFDDLGVTPLLRHIGIDSVRLWFAYTHRVNWQVYNAGSSRPFRETNYEPEAILTFGTGNEGDGFKLVNLGLSHQSNGRTESDSRGWNRMYAQGGWEWHRLSILARAWYR